MPILLADANRWLIPLPPVWLLGTAAALAMLAALAGWGILRLVAPRLATEARASLGDGFLGPLAWLLVAFAAVAVAFTPMVGLPLPPDFSLSESAPLAQFTRSLGRMTSANDFRESVTVAAGAKLEAIPLPLRPQELARIEIVSDQPVVLRTQQPVAGFALAKDTDLVLEADKPWTWQRAEGATNPFLGTTAKLEATNETSAPARVDVRWQLAPEHPQAAILPWAFVVLTAIVAAYAIFRLGCGKVAAIAAATTKEAIGQPLFAVVIVAGIALIVGFVVIPYNTFGEDVKMYKDSSLTLIKVLTLLLVAWSAGVAVSEEIEGRTALTVLSKPLTRWQFVLGKFAGLVLVALLVLAQLVGILFVLPVGGADVPIVISLLNAFTGLSVAASGYVLGNVLLIVAGTLVGASGTLLTREMAKAMGRPITLSADGRRIDMLMQAIEIDPR